MIFFRSYLYGKKTGSMKYIRDTAGFSLGEILMVLAIIGILSAMALPAFFSGQPYRRLKAASRDIYGAMQQARLKAVRENRDTILRFGADFYYIDENNNGQPDSDESRVDLSARYNDVQFVSGAVTSSGIGTGSVTSAASITFTSTGTATFNNSQNAVYIENINNPQEFFSVAVMASGAIKISWYDGTTWK